MTTQPNLPRAMALAVFLLLNAAILAFAADADAIGRITRESGPLEDPNAALWMLAGAVSLAAAVRTKTARVEWLLGAIILLMFAARELDFQKRFTDLNVGHLPDYWDPRIALGERLGVLILVAIPGTAVLVAFAWRMWSRFRAAWRRGEAWSRDVLIWGAALLLSTRLDKFHHVMPALGIDRSYKYLPVLFEETLELALAVYAIGVLVPAWRAALLRSRD